MARTPVEVQQAIRGYLRSVRDGQGAPAYVIAARIAEPLPRVSVALGRMNRDGIVERHDTRGAYSYASDPIHWRLVGQGTPRPVRVR